ncbi:protrudin-like [Anneissia japonica]|uniref:protrudin-like n=1 Tax=Anneissia japonica TaxID=1529436 RepID=UPI001425500F|nr:protrudin-like [Anneissia japonica]XP_033102926.1 protrudin-like [Anneissia japonica]
MEHYNIATLVTSYQRIQSTTWLLQLSTKAIFHILRWQTPFLTLSTWIILVAVSLTATRKQVLVWCVVSVLSIAAIGGLVRLSQIKTTEHLNRKRKSNNTDLVDTGYSPYDAKPVVLTEEEKKQTLIESRRLFLDAQDLFLWLNKATDDLYCVFIWYNVYLSSLIYGTSLLAILSFFLFPTQWCGAVLVSSILGINRGFYSCLMSASSTTYNFFINRGKLSRGDSVQEEHSPVDSDVECNSDTESMHNETKEEHLERTDIDEKEKKKKVEPLSCILCSTVFTSVLRRRRYCRYCGNQFCPKCCFKKIPRSIFGATSPAAQSAKELVCNQCYYFLTGEQVTTSK